MINNTMFSPLSARKQPKYQFIQTTADSSINSINHVFGTDVMTPPGFIYQAVLNISMQMLLMIDASVPAVNTRMFLT